MTPKSNLNLRIITTEVARNKCFYFCDFLLDKETLVNIASHVIDVAPCEYCMKILLNQFNIYIVIYCFTKI